MAYIQNATQFLETSQFEWCRALLAANAIIPVLVVLGLWIGLFAMVGMQLFRCDYKIDALCKVFKYKPYRSIMISLKFQYYKWLLHKAKLVL